MKNSESLSPEAVGRKKARGSPLKTAAPYKKENTGDPGKKK